MTHWFECWVLNTSELDEIRNQYKGNKIRITLLIEYLKARTLFEIRITPQARSIMSNFEWFLLIKYLNARTLVWDSNHSTSKIDHVELEWFYIQPKLHRFAKKLSHWLKKAQMLILLYFLSLLKNTTYMALYSLKMKGIPRWYEPRDINHNICFNEDMKKILLKLSKDISIHATLKKNEVSCYKFWGDYNLELLYFINVF